MTSPLRNVTVIGGGVVAMVAALSFARALPRTRIVLVPAPIAPDALADRWPATLPRSSALFGRLGIDRAAWREGGMVDERLATSFDGWRADGRPWWLGDGDLLAGRGGAALHQLWLRAGAEAAAPLDTLSPAVRLACAGRLRPGTDDPQSPWALVEPVLSIHPARAAPLVNAAKAAGVTAAAALAGVEASGERIEALRLVDGLRLQPDLVIDASGPAALAAGAVAPAFESWSTPLPCDRLLVSRAPSPSGSTDRYRAGENGWSADWGADRVFAYAASVTSERQARRIRPAAAELVALRPGRRCAPWRGNCLALGEAAVQPGPLARTGFALALAQLALALDLLPQRNMEPLLIAEYNRRANGRADRLRDWLASHYLAASRRRGPFWQAMSARAAPDGLAATLTQMRRRGHLPQADDDIISRDAWLSVLLGQGMRPALADPMTRGIDPGVARDTIRRMAVDLAALVAALPHAGYAQ